MRTDILYEREQELLDLEAPMRSSLRSHLEYSTVTRSEVYLGHTGYIWNIIELSNGDLCTASRDKTVKIWDRSDRTCKVTLKGHENSVLCVVELEDGTIISGSRDFSIKQWSKNGNCLKSIIEHQGENVRRCAYCS